MTSGLTTNLNKSPYWDDFTPNSQYYKVLFKPSTAVQARELTTIQSTLQNQVSTISDNIFTPGTIISGCNITVKSNVDYVKIQDNYANGWTMTITDILGLTAVSNSGLTAIITNVVPGYVSQSPNLNTLYVSYLNSATNTAIKVFQNDEVLGIYNAANALVSQITVANSISSGSSNTTGQGYSVSVDSGIIYEKGYYLNVPSQTIIVTPYSNQPNGISVGFSVNESIITSYQDLSLLDNSQGSPNYAAPGADRLQLSAPGAA